MPTSSLPARSDPAVNWLKLYAEFATDPKVQMMSEAMQRRLVMLLCLRCSGVLSTLTDDELARTMRITPGELEKTRELFRKKGFIDDTWEPRNWDKRQAPKDPTAAERMRRVRANQRANTSRNVAQQLRVEEEAEADSESVCSSPAHAREGQDLADWQEAIAELQFSPDARLIARQLQDFADVPSVRSLEAWQFIHAAHVLQSKKPDFHTWDYFTGIARKAKRSAFDAWHAKPPDPEPGATVPLHQPDRAPRQRPMTEQQLKRERARAWAREV